MRERTAAERESAASTARLFFSAAGQALHHDYQWRAEEGPVPEILAEAMDRFIDDRETSWVVERLSSEEILLLVHALPSAGKDLQLRRKRNGFAMIVPGGQDTLIRGVMISLLREGEELARRVDALVTLDDTDSQFGWRVDFEGLRSLLAAAAGYPMEDHPAFAGERLYRYSAPGSKWHMVRHLEQYRLPSRKWIAAANPIRGKAISETPFWMVLTEDPSIGGDEFRSTVPPERSRSSELVSPVEALLAGILVAALLGFVWLAFRPGDHNS